MCPAGPRARITTVAQGGPDPWIPQQKVRTEPRELLGKSSCCVGCRPGPEFLVGAVPASGLGLPREGSSSLLVYQFARAAMLKDNTLGSLNIRNAFSHSSEV